MMSWVGGMMLSVGLAAVAVYHPAAPRGLRDGVAGCLVYWAMGRLCVEGYYLVNRYLILQRPRDAGRTARRLPKSGVWLELMLTLFVGLPVAVAAAAEGGWFLQAGAAALGVQVGLGLLRLAAAGPQMKGVD